MKLSKTLLVLSSILLLASCGRTGGETTGSTSSSSFTSTPTTGTTTTGGPTSTTGGVETKSYTASLSDDAWKASFPGGTIMDSAKADSMKSYLNGQNAHGDSIIKSVDMTSSTSVLYGEQSKSVAFCIGTGSSSGSLKLSFNISVKKVSVKLTSFWKTYTNQGTDYTNYDLLSAVTYGVNKEQSLDLTTESSGPIKEQEIHYTAAEGMTSFEITNTAAKGRVICSWISFEY